MTGVCDLFLLLQDECKALLQQETARTRDLEAQIAVAEASDAPSLVCVTHVT
jgi:hypothetical protein